MGKSKVASKARQTSMADTAHPLLKKPSDHFGKQIKLPGSFWQGRMTAEEKKKTYLCTVREFELIHRWEDGRSPSNAFQLQEMGEAGEGSLEHGDASGEIFWMSYPMPFLKYFYDTFPELMLKPKGAESAVVIADDSHAEEKVDGVKPDVHPDFPNIRLSTTTEVYKYWTILSDTLCEAGPKSGQFKAEFQCLIERADGGVCGKKRCLYHGRGKAVQTTNLIDHICKECDDEPGHQAAALAIRAKSKNYVDIAGGEVAQKYTFAENFQHLVDMLWLRAAGLTSALAAKEEFQDYVRGYDVRATFPDHRTLHRIATTVHALQKDERVGRIAALKLQFKGKPCLGLQLDMWTDSDTHTSFAVRASNPAAVPQTCCL